MVGHVPLSDQVWINGNLVGSADETQEDSSFPTGLEVGSPFKAFDAVTLTEPNNASVVSDLAWVNENLTISLASDDENGNFPSGVPSTLTILASFPETGGPQDIGAFFGLNSGVLVVQSDVAETPLPAAVPLFASGLGLMGWFARRKKRKAAAY